MIEYNLYTECGLTDGNTSEGNMKAIAEFINANCVKLRAVFVGETADRNRVIIRAEGSEYPVIGFGKYFDYGTKLERSGVFYAGRNERFYGDDGAEKWSECELKDLELTYTETKYGFVAELFGESNNRAVQLIDGNNGVCEGVYLVIAHRSTGGGSDSGDGGFVCGIAERDGEVSDLISADLSDIVEGDVNE